MSAILKVTGNDAMYYHSAWFLRIIMSSSHTLCALLSVKKQNDLQVCKWMFTVKTIFFNQYTLYNISDNNIIIRFDFCDIQNKQGLSKSYQPKLTPVITKHIQ